MPFVDCGRSRASSGSSRRPRASARRSSRGFSRTHRRRRSCCARARASPPDAIASPGRAPVQAIRRCPPDVVSPDGGDAPPEVARPADLRVGPPLVRGLRHRSGDGRAGRRVCRSGEGRLPHLDRDCGPTRDRRRVIQADGNGLPELRRRVHRLEGESRPDSESRRGRSVAHRLRADRCRVGGGRSPRAYLCLLPVLRLAHDPLARSASS